jgi:hypothetical protein
MRSLSAFDNQLLGYAFDRERRKVPEAGRALSQFQQDQFQGKLQEHPTIRAEAVLSQIRLLSFGEQSWLAEQFNADAAPIVRKKIPYEEDPERTNSSIETRGAAPRTEDEPSADDLFLRAWEYSYNVRQSQ